VLFNTRKEEGMVNPATGYHLELDVYLPSLNLALEYHVTSLFLPAPPPTKILLTHNHIQEKQHFLRGNSFNSALESQQQRDQLKQELASKNGITLIVIPCWWDKQVERCISSLVIT